MEVSDLAKLRTLEDENAKLKRLLADATLDNVVLKDLLSYHVGTSNDSLAVLNAEGAIETLPEDTAFEVVDGEVIDNNPDATNAQVISADVAVPGGTIHVVDQVLLPIDTPVDGPVDDANPTRLGILQESVGVADDAADDFDILLQLAQGAGIEDLLAEPGDLTIFAPTDAALFLWRSNSLRMR